jgi:RecB family endonuclease NucS
MTNEFTPILQLTDRIEYIDKNNIHLYFDSYDQVFIEEDEVYQIIPIDEQNANIVRVGYYIDAPKILLKTFFYVCKEYQLYSCLQHIRNFQKQNKFILLELTNKTDIFQIVFICNHIVQVNTNNTGHFEIRKNNAFLQKIIFTKINLIEKFLEICLENI